MAQNDRNSGRPGKSVRGEANITALQIGGDLYGAQHGAGTFRAGLYGAIGQNSGWADNVSTQGLSSRAGDNDVTGYSLAAYGTWLDGQGGYVDAVLQGTHYDAKSRSRKGMKLATDGYGVAASLEAGHRIGLALTLQLCLPDDSG